MFINYKIRQEPLPVNYGRRGNAFFALPPDKYAGTIDMQSRTHE
jgi:hypothetical protein